MDTEVQSQEERIQRAVKAAKESFFAAESKRTLSEAAFLWVQFRLIQKRWWFLQLLVLVMLGAAIPFLEDLRLACRSMGAAAVLFIILIVPELWKNRANGCMEIETTTRYSLRQIYAARILLFGIADVLLVTVFCMAVSVLGPITLPVLIAQFLLPMTVTAAICFGFLCSRHPIHEGTAVCMCVLWGGLWCFLILDERIYQKISVGLWMALLGLALAFLVYAVRRSICHCCADGTEAAK